MAPRGPLLPAPRALCLRLGCRTLGVLLLLFCSPALGAPTPADLAPGTPFVVASAESALTSGAEAACGPLLTARPRHGVAAAAAAAAAVAAALTAAEPRVARPLEDSDPTTSSSTEAAEDVTGATLEAASPTTALPGPGSEGNAGSGEESATVAGPADRREAPPQPPQVPRNLRDALPEFFNLASGRLGRFAERFSLPPFTPLPTTKALYGRKTVPQTPEMPLPAMLPTPWRPGQPEEPGPRTTALPGLLPSALPSALPGLLRAPQRGLLPESLSGPPGMPGLQPDQPEQMPREAVPEPEVPMVAAASAVPEVPLEPEISKDVYIHLAAEDPAPTTPKPLPPRKHYKIIVIKPPTAPPPVVATTRATDVETLIYVLVPKSVAPTAPPTTPRSPSKHEVFFVRYKAGKEFDKTIGSVTTPTSPLTSTPTSTPTSTLVPLSKALKAKVEERSEQSSREQPLSDVSLDQTPEASRIAMRTGLSSHAPDEDENELDAEMVADPDAANDVLGVSASEILRSWRRSQGDLLHFDEDLKRTARSHSASSAAETSADEERARGSVESETSGDQAEGGSGDVDTAIDGCRDTLAVSPEDLNDALDGSRQMPGGPDFLAVLARRVHYGRGNSKGPPRCREKAGKPFALSDFKAADDVTKPAEKSVKATEEGEERKHNGHPEASVKFSTRYADPLNI